MNKKGLVVGLSAMTLFGSAFANTIVYQDSFDNDTLGVNAGTGGGLVNYTWVTSVFADDGNLTGTSSGNGGARAAAYTANAFSITDGFTLDVTYNIADITDNLANTASFGLAQLNTPANLEGLFVQDKDQPAGIGMSLTGRSSLQGLNELNADGTVASLSSAQTVTAGNDKTFSLTVLANGAFSYSIDGQTATTGTTTFDLTKDYYFAAYTQRSAGFAIQDVTVTAIPEPSTIGLMAVMGGGILFIRRRFTM